MSSSRHGHTTRLCLIVFAATVALLAASSAPAANRDDTDWLQARLDAGGSIFLPKLPNGECYATRGLWLSRDDTTITSDGACIVALGVGAARTKHGDGRPVRATAVFFLTHSNIFDPLPVRVSISGLHITVPAAKRMAGIDVSGHEITMSHLTIDGAPTMDIRVGGGKPGDAGMAERIAIRDSTLSGGTRDVVSVSGAMGLSVERNTLARARGIPRGQPGAGLHLRAVDRGQATLDVRIAGNTIVGNAGPGILLDLAPTNGAPVFASGIEISGNHVLRNARRAPPASRAGIVLAGGQNDGKGQLALTDNVVTGNRGPGILRRKLRLVVRAERNDLRGNTGGATKGSRFVARPAAAKTETLVPRPAGGAARDDTGWLQARLDAGGGTMFLPKLPNGACYATRGLWVSHDDTTITSDGACIVALGWGEVRLRSIDGDPIGASALFFINRSGPTKPAPVRITISNLRLIVPASVSMYGIAVAGHQISLSHLDISGSPKDDILIGGRANGNGYVGDVAVLDSTLSGAERNAISAFGVIDLRIEGNTVQGVRDSPPGQPAAGIDVEPDERSQPTLGVRIVRNTIQDNAGPGLLLELESNSGPSVYASDLEVTGNTIVRNARKRTPPKRAGIVIAGGQDDGTGTLLLKQNVVRDNGGPGILTTRLRLVVQASGNDLGGNEDGPSVGLSSGS